MSTYETLMFQRKNFLDALREAMAEPAPLDDQRFATVIRVAVKLEVARPHDVAGQTRVPVDTVEQWVNAATGAPAPDAGTQLRLMHWLVRRTLPMIL